MNVGINACLIIFSHLCLSSVNANQNLKFYFAKTSGGNGKAWKEKQAEIRSYKGLMVSENMTSNKQIAAENKSSQELEEDFM